MKRKALQDMRTKPLAELERELQDAEVKIRSLKADIMTGKVKSLKEFRTVKKSIAQLHILIGEKNANA
jgi:ribosomal protein L29